MSLKLYFHPLASFCHKALIALYEDGIAFEPILVDPGDERSRDEARDRTVAESTIVIEYLDAYYPCATRFVPADPDRAWQTRMWDRFYDHYVQVPMQKIVADRLRPAAQRDPFGVQQAKAQLREAYDVLEPTMQAKTWVMGDDFTLADCAAAPALFYANTVAPFEAAHTNLSTYLDRLMGRASFARVLEEAQPYFSLFPMDEKPRIARRA
jgi:glutathione S-transferase